MLLPTSLEDFFLHPQTSSLAPTTVIQPDLIFIDNDRRHILTERAIEGAPSLVVEILSPATHRIDRVTKAQLYAKYQVPHFWLVDPNQQNLEAYELTGDRYHLLASHRDREAFTPLLFPDLTLQLADLWA
jgi:Uma2 family endonuclease